MEFTSYKCDECGKVKGESNHWFWCARVPGPRFVVAAWDCVNCDPSVEIVEVKHLCGMGCAVKAMTKAMESGE